MSDFIKDKINNLFSEAKKDEEKNEEIFSESNFAMEDFTQEEKQEVESAIKNMMGRREAPPVTKWKWSFGGRLIFKTLLFIFENLIITAMILCAPLTINIDVTVVQALYLAFVMTYLRFWWK